MSWQTLVLWGIIWLSCTITSVKCKDPNVMWLPALGTLIWAVMRSH